MQDKEFEVLLALLRAGLWEKDVDDTKLFPLNATQWRRIFSLSCEQTVVGLVYRGIAHLPEAMMPTLDVMMKWVAQVDAIERRNEHVEKSIQTLFLKLNNEGLHPVLQKGYGIAQMYEMPLLRESGDIDLWFAAEEWDKARDVAERIAGSIEKNPDGSISYHWCGVEVEHHRRMFDLYNPFKQLYLRGLIKMSNIDCGGLTIVVPSPLTNVVLQNAHILKHAIGLGVGLRQLCDLARTYYTISDVLDGEEIRNVYKTIGLERWSNMLHTFLVDCIGLEEKYLPYMSKQEPIRRFVKIIEHGGNFGLHNKQRVAVACNTWRRKVNTLTSFMRGVGFSAYYAPMELICRVGGLLKGQFN